MFRGLRSDKRQGKYSLEQKKNAVPYDLEHGRKFFCTIKASSQDKGRGLSAGLSEKRRRRSKRICPGKKKGTTLLAMDFFVEVINERFCISSWQGVSIDDFFGILDRYFIWYNEERSKVFRRYDPIEYQQRLGSAA